MSRMSIVKFIFEKFARTENTITWKQEQVLVQGVNSKLRSIQHRNNIHKAA